MNLEWKGIYKNVDQLPVGDLPERAVKFKEPDSMLKLNVIASLFVIPVIILIILAIILKSYLIGEGIYIVYFNFPAIILALLSIFPHELLHAICFPKNQKVQLWLMPAFMGAFVVSTAPISKRRFIFLSLLPNVVFGLIPLIIWLFLPQDTELAAFVFTFSILCLSFGVGDYLNVFNASLQMPKGSIQQLSGMNSYWYMPDE